MRRLSILCTVLIFHLYSSNVSSQIKYSASDLSAIKQNKKVLKASEISWNKPKLYQLGIFYTRMYDKYKDTSMRAAIHCFKLITICDGPDYMDKVSPLAAYKLATIYEYGKGIGVDKKIAMIYYFLGEAKGKINLERLQQTNCTNTLVLHNSIGKYQEVDSLVLEVSPFCKIKGDATISALTRLADFLKINPSLRISVSVSENAAGIPAPYRYWLRDHGLKRHYYYVQNFMVEEQGISHERILAPEIDIDTPGLCRITIKILRDLIY